MALSYVAVGPICASSPDLGGNTWIWNSTAYQALQLGIRPLPTVGSLLWPKSSLDKNHFVVLSYLSESRNLFSPYPCSDQDKCHKFFILVLSPTNIRISRVWNFGT